jgi:hypothetical protein
LREKVLVAGYLAGASFQCEDLGKPNVRQSARRWGYTVHLTMRFPALSVEAFGI